MSKTKKIVLSIILTLLFAVLLFCSVWCICNFDLVKQGLSGAKLYTKSDIDKAFDDGLNQAFEEKQEYIRLIDNYKQEILDLNDIVAKDKKSLKEKDDTISNLQIRLNSAEQLRDEYKAKLDSSTSLNAELQEKYELEQTKVSNLNAEITRLKTEKTELQLNLTNAQNRIAELNQTVIGYENFIQGLLAENQVVAKFYYRNSLYSIMVLQKGNIANISNPQDTPYVKFLGWMVNNELVDVSNYPINENTTFVAKVNTFHDVQFLVDNNEYDTDLVLDGSYSKTPTNPTKEGYSFDGWAIDNVVYDVNTYPITKNTVFVAKFTKLHTVKFVFKGNAINTQTVRNNEFATLVNPELDNYTQLDYWTVNGIRVDVDTYPITSDTTFVAHVTNKYDVKFVYEDAEFNSQIVLDNGYPTKVTPTSTDYKVFKGWSLDKTTIVDYLNTPITANTTYYAVIDYYYIVTYMLDDSTVYGNTQLVLRNNIPTLPANPTKDGYEFDYWTTDKTTQVGPTNMPITADTIYYAKFTKLHNVAFYNEDILVETKVVRDGGRLSSLPANPTKEDYAFVGWSSDNVNILDVLNNIITSDCSYYAVFKNKYLSTNLSFENADIQIVNNVSPNDYIYKNSDSSSDRNVDLAIITINDSRITKNSKLENLNFSINLKRIGSGSYNRDSNNITESNFNFVTDNYSLDFSNSSWSWNLNCYAGSLTYKHLWSVSENIGASSITINPDKTTTNSLFFYLFIEDGQIVIYIMSSYDTTNDISTLVSNVQLPAVGDHYDTAWSRYYQIELSSVVLNNLKVLYGDC